VSCPFQKTKTFNIAEVGTQTDEDVYYNYWTAGQVYDAAQVSAWNAANNPTGETTTDTAKAFADEIKLAAESAMQQTGFVYEASSGLYYDYNTGYYYNAVSTRPSFLSAHGSDFSHH